MSASAWREQEKLVVVYHSLAGKSYDPTALSQAPFRSLVQPLQPLTLREMI